MAKEAEIPIIGDMVGIIVGLIQAFIGGDIVK
jgi:hypothetical protein